MRTDTMHDDRWAVRKISSSGCWAVAAPYSHDPGWDFGSWPQAMEFIAFRIAQSNQRLLDALTEAPLMPVEVEQALLNSIREIADNDPTWGLPIGTRFVQLKLRDEGPDPQADEEPEVEWPADLALLGERLGVTVADIPDFQRGVLALATAPPEEFTLVEQQDRSGFPQ